MKYNTLSTTDLRVSEICLGTMTFGEQNTQEEGHEQIDYALSKGINFLDTAEMYSVPGSKETQGSTEKIIGNWFEKTGKRNDVVLATKVTGPSPGMPYIRDPMNFSKEQIRTAIEGSLKRLKTDYVDIYQLHWPERKANFFGKMNYNHDPKDPWKDNILDIIQTMNELIQEGKIRHYGLSNETAWGVMKYMHEAKSNNLISPITVQNPYSLLNRSYEVGMAEASIRENVDLLVYSPLAFGVLSGKYLSGNKPKGSRLDLFPQFSRYSNELALKATQLYQDYANDLGCSLTQLALAFSIQRPFVGSSIIGATTMDQLKENITASELEITDEMFTELDKIHDLVPNPAP